MTPTLQYGILLSELNQTIAEHRGVPVDELSIAPQSGESKPNVKPTVDTAQASVQTNQPASFSSPDEEAKFYRSQADKLAKEAAAMRRKAEDLVPTKKKVKEVE
jgi:hypothetical protein